MATPPSDSSSSLTQHVGALYPLARVLVGSNEAESLVEDVYEHAADTPPSERPDDERGWLFRLMIEARNGPLNSEGAEAHPESESSFTDDPFRRQVASQTAERMMPAAFAACSIRERLILAIDVLAEPSDEVLASTLDTTITNARAVRDRARSTLRASLRDVLTGPERMLVDVALPDTSLRTHLRDLLADRFHPPPSTLQATVTEIIESARAQRNVESSSPSTTSPWAIVERLFSVRSLIVGLLVLGLLAGGIGGISYFSSSNPPSASGVVELSIQHFPTLQSVYDTPSSSEATAYIQEEWNRQVAVPTIQGATLTGVGRMADVEDVDIPTLLYIDDETGERIVAYAYNYALLDKMGSRATLGRELRAKLAANDSILPKRQSGQAVVLWRQRDEIFVLVSPTEDPATLRSRIQL